MVVCNHASYLDPVVLGAAFPRPLYFFAKSELFENRLFGWLISRLHAFPVRLEGLDKDAIERAIQELRKGRILVVYPEGTRSRDGRLQRGQAGAGFFAVKAGVPVIPVYLRGSFEALPPGRGMIRPGKISVHVGKPMFFPPPESLPAGGSASQKGWRQAYYQGIADRMMAALQEIKNLTE